jgi:hypothetical protein
MMSGKSYNNITLIMRKWSSHSLDGVLMVFCSPGQSPCKLFPLDVVCHPSLFAFNILIFSLKQLWNSKMTVLIRSDLKCTKIVKYYWIVPFTRGHPSYKAIFFITEDVSLVVSSPHISRVIGILCVSLAVSSPHISPVIGILCVSLVVSSPHISPVIGILCVSLVVSSPHIPHVIGWNYQGYT